MSEQPTEQERIALRLTFVDPEELPLIYVNQLAIQHQEEEFILVAGVFTPPLLLGSREEKIEQARQLTEARVRVLTRLVMNRETAGRLVKALQENIASYDEEVNRGDFGQD